MRECAAQVRHPIRLYTRYVDQVYFLLRFDAEDARDLIQRHESVSLGRDAVFMTTSSQASLGTAERLEAARNRTRGLV